MRTFRPLILCAILLLAGLPSENASADSVEICCDSSPVELFFLGAVGSGTMTPFDVELDTDPQEVVISDAIAQEKEIATWRINPAWTGSYPSSTWEFKMEYEVENAGGAQINASVTVEISGETYVGTTDQSNSFLPSGTGTLTIDIDVDSGAIPSSTDITVTFEAQTVVFSVPGTDAGLAFKWGGDDHKSSITADIPVVDILIDEPVTEGMDVYISAIIASPFGQMTSAHSNSLEVRVNGATLNDDPIQTRSGEYVRLTWTWRAPNDGEQQISVEASIQIQTGTPTLSGATVFTITTYDDGSSGGGIFYPTEEPVRTDGEGSPLDVTMEMKLDKTDGYLTLEREIQLDFGQYLAYWMRWGLDNIGSDDPQLSTPLKIFKSGMVSEDDRRNRMVDEIEETEFENQVSTPTAITYMYEGMGIELEELIGSDVQSLERFSIALDLKGERKVTYHPITMTITTLEILEPDKQATLLRNFIVSETSTVWSNIDLNINIETGMTTSLTGAEIKGDVGANAISYKRTPFGESITISADGLKQSDSFVFTAMPTDNIINTPGSLSLITIISLAAGIFVVLKMTKTKRRSALWFEMVLVPIVLAALYLATEPFTVGVITATTITIWIITAVASPTRKGGIPVANKVSDYPVIECPNCGTPNSITTEQRPFRLPCQGCGRVLKIVE
jgi:hypothetical protein